jgi:hypothetical protein
MFRIAVFFVILFSALPQAWSQEVESLAPQCGAFAADSSTKPEKLKTAEATCARNFANFRCSDVARAYPSVKEHLKKCDAKSICDDEVKIRTVPTMALGWIRGMGTSAWDTVVALGDTASALGQWAWKKAYDDPKAAIEISRKCDASSDCKRAVAAQVPWRKGLSDEDLINYSSLKLQTEALVYEGLQKLNSVKSSAGDCIRDPQGTMLSAKQSVEEMKQYAGAKLDALDDWRYDTAVRQVMQYYCVDLFGQAEFVGYRTLPVLPTSALAGAASNLARGAKATQAASIEAKAVVATEALAPARNAETISQNLASASERTPLREAFNHQNLNKTFTTPEQNQKFVSIAENVTKADGKTVFVDMENSVMKILNDRTRDKNLVTSLTNRHKAILSEKLKELQAANPGLEISLYSDFKSMRLALHGKVPENIEEQLQALWGKANTQFSNELKESMLIRNEDPAHTWFRGGVGDTADIANLFAREARNQGEVNLLMTAKSSPEIISRLNSRLSEVETLRGTLVNDP